MTRVKSFNFQGHQDHACLTTEILELFAIFAESLSMSLRDTTSARTQESTATSTVAGVASEEAPLFKASPATRGRH